jgi:PAS domain S-box-containing protein
MSEANFVTQPDSNRPRKILVVDDDPESRNLLVRMLEDEPFEILEARDGEDALVLLEFGPVDVIVSDIMMPMMDGYELCYHLRRDPRWSALPFIFCTSSVTQAEDEEFALRIGADRFLEKQASSAPLVAAIEQVLANPRPPTPALDLDPAREIAFLKEHNQRLVSKLESRNAAVVRSERQLTALLDNVNGVVWEASADLSRFSFVSQQAERWLGYPVQQWLEELNFWESHIYEPDRERVVLSAGKRLEGLQRRELEYRMLAADGRLVWVRNVVSVLASHPGERKLCGIMVDITEQRAAHQSLCESEERYRLLVERNPDAIMVHCEGMVVYANPAACRLLRVQHHSIMIGKLVKDLVVPADYSRLEEALKNLTLASRTLPIELKLARFDGTIAEIETTSLPFNYEGETAVLSILRDHTDRARLEEQLRQSQKMEAIGQLAGGVAHDFNNLLTVIQLHSSLMLTRSRLEPMVLESAQQISMTAERASNLTRQLLTFSRKQITRMVNLDLNELVGNLTKMLHRILGEDVRLQVRFSPQTPLIHADAGMMEQVLMNLSVNARDAMPRGGELIIQTEVVHLDEDAAAMNTEARSGEFVCFSVQDSGEGIPPELLLRIFEPFFTTKEVGKGTGLGLATVYGIVKQHQGWITVHSTPGMGTMFHVFLPRLDAKAVKTSERPKRIVLPRGTETILLVEDESGLRTVAKNVLQQLGYTVIDADCGASALGIYREHASEISLLLTDLVMPGGVNGRELAEQLRAEQPALRVVYTSGYSADVAGRELVLEEGINFIQKPFRTDSLAKTIRFVLDEPMAESCLDEAPEGK